MTDPTVAEIARQMVPSEIAFSQPYSDGSGDQYAVRYRALTISVAAHGSVVDFTLNDLDWFIAALSNVRAHLLANQGGGG